MSRELPPGAERRQYIRLDTVFPVQLHVIAPQDSRPLSELIQGFTSNVGKGGLCLELNGLKPEIIQLIQSKDALLSLEIDMPFIKGPVKATAKVAWRKDQGSPSEKIFLGLRYEHIEEQANRNILKYARAKKLFVPAVMIVIGVLALSFALDSYLNIKLIKGNKALVDQLIKIVQESSVAKQKIKEISKDKEELIIKLQALRMKIGTLEVEKDKQLEQSVKLQEYNDLIKQLTEEKNTLQEKLISLQNSEDTVTAELLNLDKRKTMLEKENFDKMHHWLSVHQNDRTGLVMSFEGDGDVADWGFIYDQSLAAQAFVYFSDYERAKKILDFFDKKAQRSEGAFFNAYYCQDGSPAEFIVHSGPNIWLGIAAAHYCYKTKDNAYLPLAESIAQKIIEIQQLDAEGGIKGGPLVSWYSTEHNLDAYAFFNMLYSLSPKEEYLKARDKVLSWLVAHTYNKDSIPVKRGKGDSTIATDTYAWSIAAIGPGKLQEAGMDPDRIMEFAEENCRVEVDYARPDGSSVTIKGFDFAPQKHVSRGGVVSSEWTAQMIISLKMMADFYYQKNMIAKARAYDKKADEYLSNLTNMIICSASPSGQGESCLPYATQGVVDTGHGWMTPEGKSTGSVAGTVYTLFAYYNYNPLELKD